MSGKEHALPDLPKNLDAERQVLGAILMNNATMTDVAQSMREEDFFLSAHKTIYREMQLLYASQNPIDFTTLVDSLRRSGKLELVGTASYVASLTDGMPKMTNVAYYARIVRREAGLRNLYYFAEALKSSVLEARQK